MLNLAHLEARMRQSGHLPGGVRLDRTRFTELLRARIDAMQVDRIRDEVAPYVRDVSLLKVWSREFFHQISQRIKILPKG